MTEPPDRPDRPRRYKLSRRQAWFADPRTNRLGVIPAGAHLEALGARSAGQTAASSAPQAAGGVGTGEPGSVNLSGTDELPSTTGPQWNPLGPAGVGLGQADGRPRVAGRVVSIAVHPDGLRAYAGTANGGTWYTEDAGAHWRSLDTYAETAPLTGRGLGEADALAIGAVAVAWGADAGSDVVYVGTGEPSRSVDSFFGIGVRVATGPAASNPLDPTVSTWQLEAPALVNKAVYRLAVDPTHPGVVYAATTVGLWRRAGDGASDPTVWTKVFDPTASGGCSWFDFLTGGSSSAAGPVYVVTDVVIARAAGVTPQTLYAAVQDVTTATTQQVRRSQTGDGGSWTVVAGYSSVSRTALAVAPSDPTVVYALSRGVAGPAPAAGSGLPNPPVPSNVGRLHNGAFEAVTGCPPDLTGDINSSQSDYDTVVAVDPASADILWMGGSAMQANPNADWNAALFRGAVTAGAAGVWTFGFNAANNAAPATDPSWVGSGAHPDVHAIEFSGLPATATVWLGCDGGVFGAQVLSPPPAAGARGVGAGAGAPGPTSVGPWTSLNTGLAIAQPNYLAQTTVSDALLLAGTQDNGCQLRIGPAAWKLVTEGDGGGCAIDPGHPNRRLAQYTGFTWYVQTDPTREFARTLDYDDSAVPALSTAWGQENGRASFYSQAAARLLAGGATALAFGSDRVWYCEDWGQHWVLGTPSPADGWRTLPTGTNPYDATDASGNAAPNMAQDALGSAVVRVLFAGDDQLLVLTSSGAFRLTRGTPWTGVWLSPADPALPAPAAPPAGARNVLPAGEIPVGVAIDTAALATCYVTLGVGQDPAHPRIDHVWWYDGTHWWPCGFDVTVADTPVNAVVVDTDRNVYVGSDVGVWKGVPNTAATPPTWTWSHLSHGLPEAPVVDLIVSATPHLLRAATHGRGVWELALDDAGPTVETYVRAHVGDTRRSSPAGGVDPTTATDPPPTARLDASPDLIITGPANPAPPPDLPLVSRPRPRSSDSARILQYALRRRQLATAPLPPPAAMVGVDGFFSTKTRNAVVAVQTVTPGLTPTGVVAAADWTAIVTSPYIDSLAGASADHLDMALLDRISPVNGPAGGPSLASLPAGAEVYVGVHARGWERRPTGSVRVGLLATPAFDSTLATLPPLPADWVAQFHAAVATPPAAWLTGSAAWAWIGAPVTVATARPLHPEEPQVVRFIVGFPLPQGVARLPQRWTLLAFVDDPLDPLSSAVTSVLMLVGRDRHCAARSVTLAIP